MKDSDFINVKTAAKFIGKTEGTVRHLIRQMSDSEKQLYLDKSKRSIRISKKYLSEKYDIPENEDKSDIEKSVLLTIEVLREQLLTKDKQIEEYQKSMSELSNRFKEVNWNRAKIYNYLNSLGIDDKEIEQIVEVKEIKD